MNRRSFLQMSSVAVASLGLPIQSFAAIEGSKNTVGVMRQIILGTKATGNSLKQGHRIAEVACCELIDRKITGCCFHQYINPEHEYGPGGEKMTLPTSSFFQKKPRFVEIAPALLEFIGGAELIIHHAPLAVCFLDNELELAGLPALCNYCPSVIDLWKLAGERRPNKWNYHGLGAMMYRYKIDVNPLYVSSSALEDAELLAEIYLAMTAEQKMSAS